MSSEVERLRAALEGIASCATACPCCRMHAEIAAKALQPPAPVCGCPGRNPYGVLGRHNDCPLHGLAAQAWKLEPPTGFAGPEHSWPEPAG